MFSSTSRCLLLPGLRWRLKTQTSVFQHCMKTYGTQPKYLKKSTLPTYYYQDSLLHLPIPQLERTCERYIRGITPLFPPEQVKATQKIVNEFCEGEGKKLQEDLIEYDANNPDKSYMSDPWFDMYINAREPLPLNFSAGMQFSDDDRPGYMQPVIRTTNIIVSTLKFMHSLEAETLHPYIMPAKASKGNAELIKNVPIHNEGEPEKVITALPVCMSQFKHLFKSTRIPRRNRDILKKSPQSCHMSAMRNGYFYTFDVLAENGDILPPSTIMASIQQILDDPRPPNPHPLGILTTQNRDEWADLREQAENYGNADAFDKVDSGIFMMAFDDEVMENSVALTKNFLHGTGTNRWFDKSFQLVVMGNGKVGKILEHSWGDGMTGLYYQQMIYDDIMSQPAVGPDAKADSKGTVNRIDFNLPDAVKEAIAAAQANYAAITDRLHLNLINFNLFGKNLAKSAKLSPDALAQLAYQMAFYKVHGITPPTYESCTTAIFKYGRTETLRSATIEMKHCVEMLEKGAKVQASKGELRQALTECSNRHAQLASEASLGQGFDRHLFGLRHLVNRQGGEMPQIFLDPSYAGSMNFRLSTSTIGVHNYLHNGTFGPVVPDGYGITYGVGKNDIYATVSSYENNKLDEFCDAISDSWRQMYAILQD